MKKYIVYLLILVTSLTSVIELNSNIDTSFAADELIPRKLYYDSYSYTKRYWVTNNFIIGFDLADSYLDKTQVRSLAYDNELYDVVLRAGDYLEIAWERLRKDGYQMPHKWQQRKYPVYFWSWGISRDVYGTVTPSAQDTRYSSMQLNPMYLTMQTERLLKVTTAHEFFHTVQGRYLSGDISIDVLHNPYYAWWAEATAMWVEDDIWDDIDYYVQDVNRYLKYPERTLFNYREWNEVFGTDSYKNVIFAKYLNDKYGRFVIKESWEKMKEFPGQPILAVRAILEEHGFDIKDAFTDFAVWNYFVGQQYTQHENGYSEGYQYTKAKILHSHYIEKPIINQIVPRQDGPQMYGVNYIVFDIPNDTDGDLFIKIDGDNQGDLDIYTFSIRSGRSGNGERHSLDGNNNGAIIIPNMEGTSRVVMIAIQFVGQQITEAIYQGIGYTYSANISDNAEGVSNESTSLSGFESFPTPFKYQWVAQSGVAEDGIYTIYAQPGDTVGMSLTLRNRSTDPKALMMYGIGDLLPEAPPYQGGHELRLGTDKPRDNVPSWIDVSSFMFNPAGDSNRFTVYDGPPANVGEEIVLTWDIKIADNATPDTHDLYIALLREFDAWAQEVNKWGTPISSGIFWRFVIE